MIRWRTAAQLGALALAAACTSPGKGMIALEGATLIDGSGGAPRTDALILIKDGTIRAVARVNEIKVPRGAEHINLSGKTIIPGLIDADAMVERWALPRYVVWGVTAVRDIHAPADSGFTLKKDVDLGSIIGPRVYTAGAAIDGLAPTLPGAAAVSGDEEARHEVDQRAVAGADFVMVYTKITPELLRAIIDEASSLRLRVAARVGKLDAISAAHAGVASLEDLSGVVASAMDPAPFVRAHDLFFPGLTLEEASWAGLDSTTVERTARALAATHVAIVPALVTHDTYARLDDPALASRLGMSDVPADAATVRDAATWLQRSGWSAPQLAAFRRGRDRQNQFVRDFKEAGGLVATGTGAGSPLLAPGASLHEEMALLVAAGFTPIEALTAATRHAALVIDADSLGLVAPGKAADLVVLNRNPVDDISATRDIAWVMVRGRQIKPDSLRAVWKK
ncbi:MAG TPA: amidohydrolase family protein [Gemmatimonadales bacterium]